MSVSTETVNVGDKRGGCRNRNHSGRSRCRGRVAWILAMVLAGTVVLGGVVMLLWNWLMPGLFPGLREIDFFHALGLLVLSKILFGGFRGPGGPGRFRHHRMAHLSPEERERFMGGRHGCCSRRSAAGPADTNEVVAP